MNFDYALVPFKCEACGRMSLVHIGRECSACYRSERPTCYNRPAMALGSWLQVSAPIGGKSRFRWFVDRCATHDGTGIGPNNENYPAAHGWNCGGCKWN